MSAAWDAAQAVLVRPPPLPAGNPFQLAWDAAALASGAARYEAAAHLRDVIWDVLSRRLEPMGHDEIVAYAMEVPRADTDAMLASLARIRAGRTRLQ